MKVLGKGVFMDVTAGMMCGKNNGVISAIITGGVVCNLKSSSGYYGLEMLSFLE